MSTETKCCTPKMSLGGYLIHPGSCDEAPGLPYHGPTVRRPARVEPGTLEQREIAAQKARAARRKAPKTRRMCAGYRHTCPTKGCVGCLGLEGS